MEGPGCLLGEPTVPGTTWYRGTSVQVPDWVSWYLYQVPGYLCTCTLDQGTWFHDTWYLVSGYLNTHVPGTQYSGTGVHVPDRVPGYLYQVPGYPCTWYQVIHQYAMCHFEMACQLCHVGTSRATLTWHDMACHTLT